MEFDEICERVDDLGVGGNGPVVVHEEGVGFWTIENITVGKDGVIRLEVQADTYFETEGAN